jgi:hypothetical protein
MHNFGADMLEPASSQTNLIPANSRTSGGGLDKRQTSAAGETNQTTSRSQNTEATPETPSSPKTDSVQISAEAREIARLETRDREVKAHEAAHAAVGGQYAGSPSLTYTKGPDGRNYATDGEVSISVTAIAGDPQATLEKAEIVRAAALAPAQPSAQDMRIASRAAAMATQARADLATEVGDEKGGVPDSVETEPVEARDKSIPDVNSQNNRETIELQNRK